MSADPALREAADGFFLAAEHGRSDVIKALADHSDGRLDFGDIVEPATGRTPLHVAVQHHKTDALRVLLSAGFPPHLEATIREAKCTAYALARDAHGHDLVFVFHQFAVQQVAMDNAQGVAELLAAGVPIDVTDGPTTGNTLLHWAVTCRALAVCRFLLEREHDGAAALVNHANADGATPLHIACRDGKIEFVRLLLAHGANARCTGTGGFYKDKTPIELVTSTEIRSLLARHEEQLLEAHAVTTEQSETEGYETGERTDAVDVVASLRCKHALQLEEKDLLIRQLKTTIETLVVEAEEIRKLGEERTVLDYIRKLREEKEIVRRQLEDAEDHIRIQQQQIHELKQQIRTMEVQQQPPRRPSHSESQHVDESSMTAELGELSSLLDDAPDEEEQDEPKPTPTPTPAPLAARPPAPPPLRIDPSAPRSQRRATPPRSSSGAWNDVWSVLVGNGLQADDVDADGEVIMTV